MGCVGIFPISAIYALNAMRKPTGDKTWVKTLLTILIMAHWLC